MVAKADKDGYTALSISMGHSVSAVMVKNVPYDPVNDFAPIGIFTNSAFVVAVPKNSPATDLKSLIEHVNKQSGKLNYSTVGLGSTQHLIAEDLRQRTKMNAQQVSYKTTGDVVSALLRGDAAFAVELYHAIRGQVESGDLRLVAVATPKRWPANYRTCRPSPKAAFPASAISAGTDWRFRPARRSRSSTRCTRRWVRFWRKDAVKKRLEGVGAVANLSTPAEFKKVIEIRHQQLSGWSPRTPASKRNSA